MGMGKGVSRIAVSLPARHDAPMNRMNRGSGLRGYPICPT